MEFYSRSVLVAGRDAICATGSLLRKADLIEDGGLYEVESNPNLADKLSQAIEKKIVEVVMPSG